MTTTQIAIITAGILLALFGIGWWLNRLLKQILANWRLKLHTAEENAKVERKVREQRLNDESMAAAERVNALRANHKADMAESLRRAKRALSDDFDNLSQELRELSGGNPLDGPAPTSPHPVNLGRHGYQGANGAAPQPPSYALANAAASIAPVSPPSGGRHAAKAEPSPNGTSKDETPSDDAEKVEQPAGMVRDTSEH